MEPHETPGEGTEQIDYEAPRVVELVDVEAQLALPPGSL